MLGEVGVNVEGGDGFVEWGPERGGGYVDGMRAGDRGVGVSRAAVVGERGGDCGGGGGIRGFRRGYGGCVVGFQRFGGFGGFEGFFGVGWVKSCCFGAGAG